MKKILARAIYAVFGKSIEAERAEWRKHCMDMQAELNANNWARHGWYVDYKTHETNYNGQRTSCEERSRCGSGASGPAEL